RRHTRFSRDWSSDVCSSDLADQGWQAQSQEHWEAIEAFGVRHGLLVVTRTDLMDPGPALAAAREHTAWPAVAVSGRTGAGLDRQIGRASCRGRVEIAGAGGV